MAMIYLYIYRLNHLRWLQIFEWQKSQEIVPSQDFVKWGRTQHLSPKS